MAKARVTSTESPAETAADKGWDLYQLDGYWYVNAAVGNRRQPGQHAPAPENSPELGAGPDPKEAMAAAGKEHDRREAERKASAESAQEKE